jgi:hypothetical protein
MIKFFRKIRYDLMETGRTGKYLKYAIGEIFLVVIGILLALSINTWNEERKEKVIVKNVLKNVRYDLIADTVTFYTSLKRIPIFLENAKFLLNSKAVDTLSANSLFEKLPYTAFNYKVKNQSYQKVINASITYFFEFNKLFDDINTYYTIDSNSYDVITKWDSDDTIDEGKLWAAMGFEIDIYEATFYKENEIKFAQPEATRKAIFLEQINNPTIRNSIKMNMYRKMRLEETLQDMQQRAKDIISNINEQLEE